MPSRIRAAVTSPAPRWLRRMSTVIPTASTHRNAAWSNRMESALASVTLPVGSPRECPSATNKASPPTPTLGVTMLTKLLAAARSVRRRLLSFMPSTP